MQVLAFVAKLKDSDFPAFSSAVDLDSHVANSATLWWSQVDLVAFEQTDSLMLAEWVRHSPVTWAFPDSPWRSAAVHGRSANGCMSWRCLQQNSTSLWWWFTVQEKRFDAKRWRQANEHCVFVWFVFWCFEYVKQVTSEGWGSVGWESNIAGQQR